MEKPIGFSRGRIGSVIAVAGTAAIGPDGPTVGVSDLYLFHRYTEGDLPCRFAQSVGPTEHNLRDFI